MMFRDVSFNLNLLITSPTRLLTGNRVELTKKTAIE